MGMLVWQDMPSGDRSTLIALTRRKKALFMRGVDSTDRIEVRRTESSKRVYFREWEGILRRLRPFASVVVWVPFNEGWGQFDTEQVAAFTKIQGGGDRLVDSASGWNDLGAGDLNDVHNYRKLAKSWASSPVPRDARRAKVLGEFGGLSLSVPGHRWNESQPLWGYTIARSSEELKGLYSTLMRHIRSLVCKEAVSAVVYTQLTDVETEVNGYVTCDRAVEKLPAQFLVDEHRGVQEAWKRCVASRVTV
eukprot:TRINITY_DN14611_c0_g1_i1.p2 TRINITY_DN14611_c0_g1~~TRINITY_DN14611_c0_g1_i1.p2  ORF type:complete len:249 (+),score=67.01 TRINITY_DN14611_c0_g1_i1:1327-2073(+)